MLKTLFVHLANVPKNSLCFPKACYPKFLLRSNPKLLFTEKLRLPEKFCPDFRETAGSPKAKK